MGRKKEFSIMLEDDMWEVERTPYNVRHEVFYGKNRKNSIEDGLVIFLNPIYHNMSSNGIHFNKKFDLYAKKKGQLRWMQYYDKTEQEFIERYGRSYLESEDE